ncbi:pyocin knob domain-containing protein [Bacillus altitudinis]|uniref:pyocin knob domain-containing protein n=1 Tax=Bacillus altitudinis TaxID=293387 RepID=UPI0040453720
MEIKKPKSFEVSDKAHADLFNDMVKVLLENDQGLLEQLLTHKSDVNLHSSDVEKKKWNESQIYKITADNGMQLINVSADSKIFDAIKDKGTCTFYAASGVEDSPSPSNISLRGMQIVGQNNIGAGFAVDIAGNAYSFYYNFGHTTITWTPLPNLSDLNKWNGSQLIKITNDTGGVRVSVGTTESLLDKITQAGKAFGTFYSPAGVQDNPSALSARGFYHFTSADSNNMGTFGWVIAVDYRNNVFTNYLDLNLGWQGWRRLLSAADEEVKWNKVELPQLENGWKIYNSVDGIPHTVQYSKDALGVVEIIGSITGGKVGFDSVAFTLKEGFRPMQSTHFIGVASSIGKSSTPQIHRTAIGTDGKVCVQYCSNDLNPNEFITFGFRFRTK